MTPPALLGNLDCEAAWAGVALPAAVRARISLYGTLFAACAPASEDAAQLWLPAPVDPARLVQHPGWIPPIPCTGTLPPSTTFAAQWADPTARAANDRSLALAIGETLGIALPGARMIHALAELDAHAGSLTGPWVCKARWTSAGRDRAHGTGAPVGELRTRLERMLARFGPLVFEPWLDRVADYGVCGTIAVTGDITVAEPHGLRSDPRGGFLGIELAPDPPIDAAIAEALRATARAAALQLAARTGYIGPFAVDAFTYRIANGALRLHALCEMNARHTFGWIARGLARRLGIRRLGFDAPPPGALVLIASANDRVTAWVA